MCTVRCSSRLLGGGLPGRASACRGGRVSTCQGVYTSPFCGQTDTCENITLVVADGNEQTSVSRNAIVKQECIPVGCIPPSHWSYLVISYACPPQPCMYPSNHTCPPTTMHTPWQSHRPPQQPCMPPHNHAHLPCNHACPQQPCMPLATTHAPWQPCMPPLHNHAPPGNHACHQQPCTPHSPRQPHTAPPITTNTPPPMDRQTPVKHNLRKLRLRAVKIIQE